MQVSYRTAVCPAVIDLRLKHKTRPTTLLIHVIVMEISKVKVHTLDIAPLRSESPPQKRSGMARVLNGYQFYLHTHTFIRSWNEPAQLISHSFTCTPTRSSAIGMSHTRLCLPSISQYQSQIYLARASFIIKTLSEVQKCNRRPQLVLIYRPRRDGMLSRPWC